MISERAALSILEDLCSIPTAPFHESRAAGYVREFAARHGLELKVDGFGNHVVRHRGGRRAIAFSAHLDHPGFDVPADGEGEVWVDFLGSVRPAFFPGAKVIFASREAVRGRVLSVEPDPRNPDRAARALVRVRGRLRRGDFGTWDLWGNAEEGGLVRTRAADDLAGAAMVLLLLAEARRRGVRADVLGIFTRAEEVGFAGTLALCQGRLLPPGLVVVSVETSSALAGAEVGGGIVVRVGDRMSTFTPAVSLFLAETAKDLAGRRRAFSHQRKLMDGGACEASAYAAFGFPTGALALPLGNYHNMDHVRGRIAPEEIHVRDFQSGVELGIAAAERLADLPGIVDRQRKRFAASASDHIRRLKKDNLFAG